MGQEIRTGEIKNAHKNFHMETLSGRGNSKTQDKMRSKKQCDDMDIKIAIPVCLGTKKSSIGISVRLMEHTKPEGKMLQIFEKLV